MGYYNVTVGNTIIAFDCLNDMKNCVVSICSAIDKTNTFLRKIHIAFYEI